MFGIGARPVMNFASRYGVVLVGLDDEQCRCRYCAHLEIERNSSTKAG